jgi:two-component system, LytTR family, response regulator LytT
MKSTFIHDEAGSSEKTDGLKILAIDSDRSSVSMLEQYCHAILGRRLEQFTPANSLDAATTRMGEVAFDVVLLEPRLPDGDGLALLSERPARSFQTIIVSSCTDVAMHAFEHGVLDFVPKPAGRERLARALHRMEPRTETARPSNRFLAVRQFGRIDLISVDDLIYVEGADKYSELVLSNGQRSFHDKCLGRLEATLPSSFVRIHKSYLVRFPMISRLLVMRGSRYYAELKNGLRLPVGRSRYEQIKSRLI